MLLHFSNNFIPIQRIYYGEQKFSLNLREIGMKYWKNPIIIRKKEITGVYFLSNIVWE
jgi:hypothetical protein